MTPAGSTAIARTRWDVIVLTTGAGLLAAFQVGKIPAALPELRSELMIGFVAAGWIASILSATSALFGVTAGLLSDRFGHRRLILANLAFMAIGSTIGGLAPDATWLFVSRVLEGVAFLGLMVSVPSLMLQAVNRRAAVLCPRALERADASRHGAHDCRLTGPIGRDRLARYLVRQYSVECSFVLAIAARTSGLPPLAKPAAAGRMAKDLRLALTRPGAVAFGCVLYGLCRDLDGGDDVAANVPDRIRRLHLGNRCNSECAHCHIQRTQQHPRRLARKTRRRHLVDGGLPGIDHGHSRIFPILRFGKRRG